MMVGLNPYRGPLPCPPAPAPASGMPPSRFPGAAPASGAALTVLTGTAAWLTGAVAPFHATGTDNLPTEPAPQMIALEPAAAEPKPARKRGPRKSAAAIEEAAPAAKPRRRKAAASGSDS